MTTAIEQTLPAVPAALLLSDARDAIAEIVAEVDEMNADSWTTFAENGIDSATEVHVEYAFSAGNQELAEDLAEYLQNADYDAEAKAPVSELDDWTVAGTTPPVTASAAGLAEWVQRMAAVGWAHGECQFDGWSAILP